MYLLQKEIQCNKYKGRVPWMPLWPLSMVFYVSLASVLTLFFHRFHALLYAFTHRG